MWRLFWLDYKLLIMKILYTNIYIFLILEFYFLSVKISFMWSFSDCLKWKSKIPFPTKRDGEPIRGTFCLNWPELTKQTDEKKIKIIWGVKIVMFAPLSVHSCGHWGTNFLLLLSEPLFNRIMCRIYICRNQSLQQNVKPHQSSVSQVHKTIYFILNFFIIFIIFKCQN